MKSTGKGLEQHEILKVEWMRNQSRQDILTRIWNIVSRMDKLIIPKENNHAELDKYNNLIQLCREKKYEDALSSLNSVQNHQDESLAIDVIKPSDKETNDRNNNEVESAIVYLPTLLLM